MATTPTTKPKRVVNRKPAGPKPVYVVYGTAGDGSLDVRLLTTDAEAAMLKLVEDPSNKFYRGELPVARRAAPAPEAASETPSV